MQAIKTNVFLLNLLLFALVGKSQTIVPLYTSTIPNNKPCNKPSDLPIADNNLVPVLYAYLPIKADSNRTAIIICPGGGYNKLVINHEGHQVAKEMNKKGIAAFVLKYRNPVDKDCFIDRETVPLQDAQQAIKLLRDRCTEFGINPESIGIMGFSAGGHLASTAGTHFTTPVIENLKNTNLRPNFMALIYPVISFMDSLVHLGSRNNLLGSNPSENKKKWYSNEYQVTQQTPPTFLVHAADDKAVLVGNSLAFFMALQANKVPSEMHIFQKGGHGFGMNNSLESIGWMLNLFAWLKANQLIRGNVNN